MNAFMLGMQSVNPKARLKFILINSWYDPGKEGDAAKALIDQGCDIITQHTDSPTPLQVAESRGIPGLRRSDRHGQVRAALELTANVNVWGPYYIKRIQAVIDGTWTSEDVWGGFAAGMLKMSPFANMPDDVKALAQQTVDDITSGKNKIFVGPLGSERRGQAARRPGDGRQHARRTAMAGPGHRRQAGLKPLPPPRSGERARGLAISRCIAASLPSPNLFPAGGEKGREARLTAAPTFSLARSRNRAATRRTPLLRAAGPTHSTFR